MRKASSLTGMRSNRESQGEQAAFRLVRWVWWACQDLNRGPHPYQQNAGNRCATRCSRRSRSTVEAKVVCSHRVQLCALSAHRDRAAAEQADSLSAPHIFLYTRIYLAEEVEPDPTQRDRLTG